MEKELSKTIEKTTSLLGELINEIPRLSQKEITTIATCMKVLGKHKRGGVHVPSGHLNLPDLCRLYQMRSGDMSTALLLLKNAEPNKYKRVKIPGLGHFSYVYSPMTVKAVEKYVKEITWTPDKKRGTIK